jgi:hypothetical protein
MGNLIWLTVSPEWHRMKSFWDKVDITCPFIHRVVDLALGEFRGAVPAVSAGLWRRSPDTGTGEHGKMRTRLGGLLRRAGLNEC